MRLTELYKKLDDKPLIENEKTYGDLSPEEWEAEREKIGMKTDDEGNQYIDNEYDSGNEPLEIQMTPDQGEYANKIFYIEAEDIEAYVNGEDVEATNPGEREYDKVTANRQNSDVTGVSEEELEDFLVSGDRSASDRGEGICTAQELEEGTCAHALDGDVDVYNTDNMTPSGPHLFYLDEEKQQLQEIKTVKRFKKLANLKEQKIPPGGIGKTEPKKVCCDQNAINYGWSEFTDPNPYSDPCSSYNYWHQYATQDEYGYWSMEDMVIPDPTHWFSAAGAEFMNQGGKVDTFLMQGPNSIDSVIECDPSVCCGGGQDIKKLKKPLKEAKMVSRFKKLANIK